jgi:hypothetical protein
MEETIMLASANGNQRRRMNRRWTCNRSKQSGHRRAGLKRRPLVAEQLEPRLLLADWSGHEDFENGWGEWTTDGGIWEIGTPASGPDSAYEGNGVAGTVLDGNYPADADSRLISPVFGRELARRCFLAGVDNDQR